VKLEYMKTPILLALVAFLALAACQRSRQGDAAAAPQGAAAATAARGEAAAGAPALAAELESLGFQIPSAPLRALDFELEDLGGAKRSLGSYAGKVVFLNFWATWCPPCRAEMPSMQSLYQELEAEGLVMLAVNSQEPPEEVRRFVKAGGYGFPVLLDESGKLGAAYAVRAIPTTYLVSRDGYVLGRLTGSRDWFTAETLAVLRRVLQP